MSVTWNDARATRWRRPADDNKRATWFGRLPWKHLGRPAAAVFIKLDKTCPERSFVIAVNG